MKKKKRIVAMLCVTMILMFCFRVTALASGGSLAFNISGADSVKQGETITIEVNANKASITDGKSIITYDESKLTYQGGKLAYSTEENQSEFVVNSNEKGKLIVLWATVKPMEASGTVFTLDFTASKTVDNGQSTELDLDVEYVNDSKGNSIEMATNGNKNSMTIAIGDKIPETKPDTDPDTDSDPDKNEGSDSDQNKDPDSDKNESSDSNQNKDPGSDKNESSESNQNKDPDSDKNESLDSNQNKDPDSDKNESLNSDQNKDPDSNKNESLDSDQDKDSSSDQNENENSNLDSDADKTQDTGDSNNKDSDEELHSTESYTPIMRYLVIFIILGILILGVVIFKFASRFKEKGE